MMENKFSFDRLSYEKIAKDCHSGGWWRKMGGSGRGGSLDVCETLWFSPLGALTMSLLSKIERILKK